MPEAVVVPGSKPPTGKPFEQAQHIVGCDVPPQTLAACTLGASHTVNPPFAAVLSWLRRRGPPLPEAALHKLFRSCTVRVYDPATQQVCRASRSQPLPAGATLLIPKAALALPGSGVSSSGSSSSGIGAAPALTRPQSQQQQRAAAAWASQLRGSLLAHTADYLAINKPGGLACQGGSGITHSVDCIKAAAFADLPGLTDSSQLRLVHRLDRQTSGALLLATSADAAAWLAAAFRTSTSTSTGCAIASSDSRRGRRQQSRHVPAPAGADASGSIEKWYWAVVALPEGGTSPPAAGTIRLPVPGGSGRGPGVLLQAETRYRVLYRSPTLAWLELQPCTGRKHQLRLHCARGLGAAVLGDGLYGELKAAAQADALARLRQAQQQQQQQLSAGSPASGSGAGKGPAGAAPLFLHCRRLLVRGPGGAGRRHELEVSAPLPSSWRVLLAQQGWPLPADG